MARSHLYRSPTEFTDALTDIRIDRYIGLLSTRDAETLSSSTFVENASRIFLARGSVDLAKAVSESLSSLDSLQKVIEEEFFVPEAINHVLDAYGKAYDRTVSAIEAKDFPTFVRFCVAYRIHCYFETSQLPASTSTPKVGRPQVVFVLGGPGAGKGTQCARISRTFGFKHLSAGDLLREERTRPGSAYGELIESYIKEGKLVPVEITVKLLQQAMEKHGWEKGKFLIDGFPRSFDNLQGWDKLLAGKVDVNFVLFFDCSEACMEARILERGKTSGRADDNLASVKKRFQTFKQESMPVVEHFESKGLLRKVSAEKSEEEVWVDVRAIFGPSVVFVLGGPGSGKGTVCERITEQFGYTHLSAGDLLREERNRRGSQIGELIETHIKEGKLVPAEITVTLLKQAMEKHGWQGGKYLIDGFPRSLENLEAWENMLQDEVLPKFILFLDCSEKVMEVRLLERGKTSGRSDDNIETIRKRFMTFRQESLPVVEKFEKQRLVRRIDATRSQEEVWQDVQVLFGPTVVFVLGGPGSGKGTQCARIADMFAYRHLSAGDLLREERNRPGSEYGDLINEYIKEGKLVPVDITVNLLLKAMKTYRWEGGRYLIDGFPRSFDNLEGWQRVVGNKVHVKFALFFDVSEATMEVRLLERGKTSGRADDNLESIKKRFVTFQHESMPVIEKFHKEGLLRRVNSEQPVEQVWHDVQRHFGPSVIFVLGGPGAGKGTQCSRIAPAFGFHHLSAGDLLREERKRPGSELGELIESHIKEGKLVPVEITVKLLQKAMEELGWEGRYLIDGFPRSFDNLAGWEKLLGTKVDVKCTLYFHCSEAVMEARLLERGKTSGRADDNLESIKKRFKTFMEESLPVVEKFAREGTLRRIDSEQDTEEVWSCVQEVLHHELDRHLPNQAVVLVKPSAYNQETIRFVQSFLTTKKVAILSKGICSTKEVAEKGMFDKQYIQLVNYANSEASSYEVPPEGQELFKTTFGLTWSEALSTGAVISASKAIASGITAKELFDSSKSGTVTKLAPSLYVDKIISSGGKPTFVINAFIPFMRDEFVEAGEALAWFVVEFDTTEVSWKEFRSQILGSTNPAKASKESIRGQLFDHWEALGLKAVPTTLDNGVHFSAGPLEGLRERLLWTGCSLDDDSFGRLLLASGVPELTIQEWLGNIFVSQWPVGLERRSGLLFACSEDSDSITFRASALQYLRENGAQVGSWTVRRRQQNISILKKIDPIVQTEGGERAKHMTILHFNDVYNVEPRKQDPVGGIARFVTRMRQLKAESVSRGEHEAVCLFSGDAFNPSLTSTTTYGRHMVTALNAVGIHTACYGNHDFDFGIDQLEEMAAETNFPWLISNVSDKATGRPLANGLVSRMMDFHGRKIGLIGLVEKEWLVTLATIDPSEVIYEDFCPCGRRLAKHLKEKDGAEIVIALTHMRVPNDELLAHEVPEIDIILGGHDHHYDVKPVGPHGTYVLKSGTDFRDITVLQLTFTDNPGSRAFEVTHTEHVEIVSSIEEDPEMKVFVDDCMAKLGAAMDVVIGQVAVDLDCRFSSVRTQETNVGNFVTDIMKLGLKADIAFLNSGTLRADAIIEQGEFRVRDLVNLLPMLDELCLLQISGQQVLSALENAVSQYPRLEGRFAQVSGISFSFDAARPPGHRLVEDSIRVGNETLVLDKQYKLVTKDYLRHGKDGFDVFRDCLCLADGEQAGILPTMVRDHWKDLEMLNGQTKIAKRASVLKAQRTLAEINLARVGDGPEPLKRYAIEPRIEGRIVCLNPVT